MTWCSQRSQNALVWLIGSVAWEKFLYTEFFRRTLNAVKRNRLEKLRTRSWFVHHENAPAHRSVWVKYLSVKNKVTTLEHLSILLTWLQLTFACCHNRNQHWTDGAFVMLLTSFRMRRNIWNGFHNVASRNVSNNFTDSGRIV